MSHGSKRRWQERRDAQRQLLHPYVPYYVRQYVHARDRHKCHLCGLRVRYDVHVKHPWYVTVDHLIPRVEGGTNDLDNLGTAHRWCNQYRADRSLMNTPLYVGGPPESDDYGFAPRNTPFGICNPLAIGR